MISLFSKNILDGEYLIEHLKLKVKIKEIL